MVPYRSVQLVCIAGHVYLVSVSSTDTHGHTKLEIRHPAQLDHQGAQVWRVEWDMTGTILATAADDGLVRLWKGEELLLLLCKSDCFLS